MRRLRKVFASHGGELAHKLLAALENQRMVARFVDAYVAELNRRSLQADARGYRDLLGTLSREALLAMVARVDTELPRYLTRRRPPLLRGEELETAAVFSAELLGSLGRALRWTPADVEEFRRDLALYAQLSARTARVNRSRKPSAPPEGPFADRCALLLDPSMLEKGRRAAGKFQVELERVTEETLASVLRRRP